MNARAQDHFDVIVVGSGASGGWAAKRLSEAGLNVALVDAGRRTAASDFSEHKPDFELKYRNRADEADASGRGRARTTATPAPSTTTTGSSTTSRSRTRRRQDKPFSWQGRTAHRSAAARTSGRARATGSAITTSRRRRFDGYGEDWPLGYDDLAPYYDLVEDYVGICGHAEGVPSCPTASSCRRCR